MTTAHKKIIFTVTNDLSQDQRMSRICSSLSNAGYDVTLVGRKLPASKPLTCKPYKQKLLYCFFSKGKLFYAEYNLRLFIFLLFNPFDILCGIDLDTILPTYSVAKIKRKPFVYDAHEYFTEMDEVVTRPFIKKAWETLEKFIVPGVKYGYTVSDGYSELFRKKYNVQYETIRNTTLLNNTVLKTKEEKKTCYILYQGSVNVGRGLENLVRAMQHIDCQLYICGKGDILDDLKMLSTNLHLENKITFWGFVDPEPLKEYTQNATIGITFFSNIGLSNYFSLANRFFDYLHSGIPQIAMNYPEYKMFNERHEVALLIENHSTQTITASINKLLNESGYYEKLRDNCLKARQEYNWQNEEIKLLQFYQNIG